MSLFVLSLYVHILLMGKMSIIASHSNLMPRLTYTLAGLWCRTKRRAYGKGSKNGNEISVAHGIEKDSIKMNGTA